MGDWRNYVRLILGRHAEVSGLLFSYGDGPSFVLPKITLASAVILDEIRRFQEASGECPLTVFVLPGAVQLKLQLVLSVFLQNVAAGVIGWRYDPHSFVPGEKLKLGNAVVEFAGFQVVDNVEYLKIKLANRLAILNEPESFPLFQKTNTKRALSPHSTYKAEKDKVSERLASSSPSECFLCDLIDHRTHFDGSVAYVTSIASAVDNIARCEVNKRPLFDALLVGKVDFEGSVSNASSGQLDGIPPIILASELSAVIAALENGVPIRSVIVDVSSPNVIQSQLAEFDDLVRFGLPITCLTDSVNSFEVQSLRDRGFKVWRWDSSSIAEDLIEADFAFLGSREIRRSVAQKVRYERVESKAICATVRGALDRRTEIQSQSDQMMRLFERIYKLASSALHRLIPYSEDELRIANETLDGCMETLGAELHYIGEASYQSYVGTIDQLRAVYSSGYLLPKCEKLASLLRGLKGGDRACLVISERDDKRKVSDYWMSYLMGIGSEAEVCAVYPAEFYSSRSASYSLVIIAGWLRRVVMRKTLYGLTADSYTILMYDCEIGWNAYDVRRWKTALDKNDNLAIARAITSNPKLTLLDDNHSLGIVPASYASMKEDDSNEIDQICYDNRLRRYTLQGSPTPSLLPVEAIPVNFVGNCLALYKRSHKIISASGIISNRSRQIEMVYPESLKTGDFIVERRRNKDLIGEMADIILNAQGKGDARKLAGKWRDPLKIESVFCSTEDIFHKLREHGCPREFQTVQGWIEEDGIIAPQSKEDLRIIAKATGNEVVSELLDQIYEAAQDVRAAHIQAGRLLSEHLRKCVAETIAGIGGIDPANIWAPIELEVDGVGDVQILKVVSVGEAVVVSASNANRLIEE